MMKQMLRAGLASLAILLFAAPSFALDKVPFTDKAFEDAQKADKPILIDVFATWCPICKAQAPVIQQLAAKPEYKDLTIFEVNFDTQKAVMKHFRVGTQSTLIAFKGAKETARSVGETSASGIEAVIKSAF
jgi:thiol-disulfide isomerase/thioredoxin